MVQSVGKTVRTPRGFTLVELVVGLTILGVLFAIALPSYSSFVAEQALAAEARRLAEAVSLARSEAIKRNGFVVVCAGPAAAGCSPDAAWHEGWTMFEDRDGNAELDPSDPLIGAERRASTGVSIAGNAPVDHYLRFNYVGMARTVTGALQMGTFEVCRSGYKAWRVVLANSGRARLERGASCA